MHVFVPTASNCWLMPKRPLAQEMQKNMLRSSWARLAPAATPQHARLSYDLLSSTDGLTADVNTQQRLLQAGYVNAPPLPLASLTKG
jgi:hypothetical protein